jgi:hypothetical protein
MITMINLEHLFLYVTHSISNGLWNLFLNLYLDLLEFEINFNFNFNFKYVVANHN